MKTTKNHLISISASSLPPPRPEDLRAKEEHSLTSEKGANFSADHSVEWFNKKNQWFRFSLYVFMFHVVVHLQTFCIILFYVGLLGEGQISPQIHLSWVEKIMGFMIICGMCLIKNIRGIYVCAGA